MFSHHEAQLVSSLLHLKFIVTEGHLFVAICQEGKKKSSKVRELLIILTEERI